MKSFAEKLLEKKPLITAEFWIDEKIDQNSIQQRVKFYDERIDALNVVDNPGSNVRTSPIVVAHLLQELNLEPIVHLTCRDRNRSALESDLLGMHLLELKNVLALSGDYPTLGNRPQTKPVFDLDSVQLLGLIQKMKEEQNFLFCAGAVINLNPEQVEWQILKMNQKIKVGARFFQTQPIWKVEDFIKFKSAIRPDESGQSAIPILAGILVLKSAKMAKFINEHIPGLTIPTNIVEEMETATDQKEKGIEIATRLARDLITLAEGIYLMTMGADEKVAKILEQIKILLT
ncbi:MAG: methylenetetrahydrofolate reductase [Candidatus Edwardsbacteria bacterium]